MYRQHKFDAYDRLTTLRTGRDGFSRRSFLMSGTAAAAAALFPSRLLGAARAASAPKFRQIQTQYIAALGDPKATSGTNAQSWGLWRQDPGPRGVPLGRYERLKELGGVAPAGWKFDDTDWWLEEHGLIMEAPKFPIPPGTYLVTGDREKQAALTVHPTEKDGTQRWDLDSGANLYDVTHLRCRSARYTPATSAGSCSPAKAQAASFPVRPGAEMPPVGNCHKQDYTVLIVIGMAEETRS
jgi:hypothetical protein